MVLQSGRGYTVPQIAEVHDCGEDAVRFWLRRYRERGVAGLADEPRSGRPPRGRLAAEIVDTQAGQWRTGWAICFTWTSATSTYSRRATPCG
jgi:transposase